MTFVKIPGTYRGLPKSVYVLFFASVVNSVGNFVWPFLALFLTDRLGMSKAAAGFFVALSALAYVPGSLIGGKIADHLGRKRVFIVSRVLSALLLVPCAFLGRSMAIPWLLIASGVVNGANDPAIAAMLADLTNSGNRQAAFSLMYLGHNLGFALGPTLAGLLYRNHLPWLFLGDALTTVLSVILVGAFVLETLPERQSLADYSDPGLSDNERPEQGGVIAALLRRPLLLAFSFTTMVYSFAYAQVWFSLPIQVTEVFGSRGPQLYGSLGSLNAIIVVAMTTLLTRWTEKVAPIRMIAAGGILYACGFGLIYLAYGPWMFVFSTVVWTLGEIVVTTNTGAFVANNTPITHRGRINGVLEVIRGAGQTLGPVMMGRFVDRSGVRAVWPLTFALAFLGATLVFLLGLIERGQSRRKGEAFTTGEPEEVAG